MEMQTEFNWYIVLNENDLRSKSGSEEIYAEFVENSRICINYVYTFEKSDYRIYPMDTPIPLIYNGKCIALVSVTNLLWKCNKTTMTVQPILSFEDNDPVADYYESSFQNYKRQQEIFDDGGKVDLRQVVNPMNRMRF